MLRSCSVCHAVVVFGEAACKMVCKAYMTSYKLHIIITRGNNVYGPHQVQ
jgi:dTDP-D-glucose 4,6-dehydratase